MENDDLERFQAYRLQLFLTIATLAIAAFFVKLARASSNPSTNNSPRPSRGEREINLNLSVPFPSLYLLPSPSLFFYRQLQLNLNSCRAYGSTTGA
jgi:hypothetical protein